MIVVKLSRSGFPSLKSGMVNMPRSLTGSLVAVTGGAGFIGSHLVERLLQLGVSGVTVIDSLAFGSETNLLTSDPRVKLHKVDLGAVNVSDLAPALAGVKFVFHLAAEKHNASVGNPNQMLSSNVQGTLNVLEASLRSGVEKVIFTSSLYAYGRIKGVPFREDEVVTPSTVYGASKVCGEHLVRMYSSKMETAILRYLFVFGPRQWANAGYKSVIVKNFERMLAGKSPVILGDGGQVLDYIYVDDAVEATIQAMTHATNGALFNVGTGRRSDILSLTKTMMSVADFSGAPSFEPPDWTAGSSRVADISRIGNEIGWRPAHSLEEGLARTFSWLKDR
jgi:UDP-glucose 4-epimerase